GSPPNRLATICAAPVASRRKTPSSPNRPNDTTVILRSFSAACTVATVEANVSRETMTGALSRLTKDSIVTTNLHSNNVQVMCEGGVPPSCCPRPLAERLLQPVCEYPAAPNGSQQPNPKIILHKRHRIACRRKHNCEVRM